MEAMVDSIQKALVPEDQIPVVEAVVPSEQVLLPSREVAGVTAS
jgi:hypothetical protein